MRIMRVFVLCFGFFLCVVWPLVITPGNYDDGHFYYGNINGRIFAAWVVGWCIILAPPLWLAKKLGKK